MASGVGFSYPLPDFRCIEEPWGVPTPYRVSGVHDGGCDPGDAAGYVCSFSPLFPFTEIDCLG